ncbi:PKD domain-containing protein [Lentzea sp. NEAU-D7]|uniref:PKD domain-containing protein n=1 Tax=Lentzea sp. NEAU-D7 TaxID=2994667 RepID=UPI00224B6FA4|nr:PKD domain-containing protein [Lentzea sp. NEAU-D7]MCX2949566.1 PKD domain-containing protein [Lentzea sp. NEAU-D7]
MRLSKRILASAFAAAVFATFAPVVALAAAAGDDFDSATDVTALPFQSAVDTTGATKAADDPNACNHWGEASVWLRYTAPADGLVRLRAESTRFGPFFGVFTGQRGALAPVPGACDSNSPHDTIFSVQAGVTYHVMLVEYYSWYAGPVNVSLTPVAPSPNDDRAAAAPVEISERHEGDLRRASAEPGEPAASCDAGATQSVWYRYTPAQAKFVRVQADRAAVSVYRASDLSEVDCEPSGSGNYQDNVFSAVPGESYLVRVADSPAYAGPFSAEFGEAPPLSPGVSSYPSNPSVFTELTMEPYSGVQRPLVSGTVQFGDGGSAQIVPGQPIKHRYAADGQYTVTVTGSTKDGRTGTGTRTLKVDTHDVAVTAFTVPASARAGQTKQFKVSVANTRQDETVRVTLYKVGAAGSGYDLEIGHTTQWVPASASGVSDFPFAYTYSAEDAVKGSVEFRVQATLPERAWDAEARPEDNQARAKTTSVRKAAGTSAVID